MSGGVFVDTLTSSDKITGTGGTTDTLFAQLTAGAVTTVLPNSVSGIEVVSLEVLGGNAQTLDLSNGDSSVTTVKVSNSTTAGGTATVQGIQSAVNTVELSNVSQNVTVTGATAKFAATTDAVTLKLNAVTAGAVVLQPSVAGSGFETINLQSNGSVANVLASLSDGLGNSLATINVSGSQNVTFTLLDTTVTTVNAVGYTGKMSFTSVAGSGAQAVTGGSGNDTINLLGTYTTADVINGGDGTDKLVMSQAQAILATTANANITNIETIGLSDINSATAITVNNLGGATGLQLFAGGATNANLTANFATGTNSFDFQDETDGGAETFTLTVAGTSTADVMNVTMGTTAAAAVLDGGGLFTITGAETVNLTAQGGATTYAGGITLTDTAANQALVVKGAVNFVVTGAVRADSIDASGMTGSAVLQLNGGTGTTATTITGTGNADVLIGSTVGDIINGGAGADTITNTLDGAAATAGDVLTGGAGFDSFVLIGSSAAAANYAGSATITDFTVGTSATTTDLIVLSSNNASYSAGLGVTGTAAGASGAVGVQSLAQNAAAAQSAGVEFIKLSTGVAYVTGLQETFNAAIGTGSITGVTSGVYAGSFYDTTNSMMVIVEINSATANATLIDTGDVVRLIGTVSMTAADYATLGTANFGTMI